MEQLCHDSNVGHAYGFPSPDFSKQPKIDEDGDTIYLSNGGDYDTASIMHYDSFAGAKYRLFTDLPRQDNALKELPLLVWKDRSPTFQPPKAPWVGYPFTAIVGNKPPSAKDKERVLQLYPWNAKFAPGLSPSPRPVTPTPSSPVAGTQGRAPTNWS